MRKRIFIKSLRVNLSVRLCKQVVVVGGMMICTSRYANLISHRRSGSRSFSLAHDVVFAAVSARRFVSVDGSLRAQGGVERCDVLEGIQVGVRQYDEVVGVLDRVVPSTMIL